MKSRLPKSARVFISGGGSGLGRALAVELGRRGARVLVGDVNEVGAAETVSFVQAAGGEGASIRCDVTRLEDWSRVAEEVERRWGGLDLLVNNAGVAAGGRVGDVTLEDWDWILRVNLWGVIHGCHTFVPRMREAGGGFILNVASAAGFASLPEMGSYNVTKAGVVALSETLFAELGRANIRVSVLCPTFFSSGLMQSFRSPSARERAMAMTFFHRSRTTSEDVARAALKGLERGKLHIVPQADGRLVWRLKRWVPGLYARALRRGHAWISQRLLKGAGSAADASADMVDDEAAPERQAAS